MEKSIKKVELRAYVYDRLSNIFSKEKGFQFKKANEGKFIRKTEEGWQEITLAIVDYRPTFYFSPIILTRINAIQDILNHFTGVLPKYYNTVPTIITQLDYFTGKLNSRFEISNKEELKIAVDNIYIISQEKILPFLEKYKGVKSLDQDINSNLNNKINSRFTINGTVEAYRSMAAITLAYLTNNPLIDKIISYYEQKINEAEFCYQSEKEKFYTFLNHLKQLKVKK